MGWHGVLFDLFGTLVPCFSRARFGETLQRCADTMGVEASECERDMVDAYPARMLGLAGTFHDQLAATATRLGAPPTPECRATMAAHLRDFVATATSPAPEVLAAIDSLRHRGLRTGLVSNCNPDVAAHLRSGALAGRIDGWALSAELGVAKPDPAIYLHACSALALEPADLLFVGDGSDDELAGAARCGLTPVLVRVDRSDAYDDGVSSWDGLEIPDVIALERLL